MWSDGERLFFFCWLGLKIQKGHMFRVEACGPLLCLCTRGPMSTVRAVSARGAIQRFGYPHIQGLTVMNRLRDNAVV